MKDTFGRTIDYLRISLTDRCNFRCIYCMPEEGVAPKTHEQILRIEEIANFVRIAAECGIKRVRLTGGEPLVRYGVIDLIRDINNIEQIKEISLTTNAVLLPKYASELKDAGLSRVNISLDTLDDMQFSYITRKGKLADVLHGIDVALETGFHPVKINCVALRSLNQDFLRFAQFSVDKPLHVRFIEYMPIGTSAGADGCGWSEADIIPSEELREIINTAAINAGLGKLEPLDDKSSPGGAGPATYWAFPNSLGSVGFISSMSNHFCSSCNRVRLTADGKLRPCLFSDDELDVATLLKQEGADSDPEIKSEIKKIIMQAIKVKPDEHHDETETARKMSQIGG